MSLVAQRGHFKSGQIGTERVTFRVLTTNRYIYDGIVESVQVVAHLSDADVLRERRSGQLWVSGRPNKINQFVGTK